MARVSRLRRALVALRRLAPVVIPLWILIDTGRAGIDLGLHWDEHLQFRLVARTLKSGVLVPGVYNYPTVSYWLTLSTVLPRLVKSWRPMPDLIQDINTQRSLEQDTTELQTYALNDHALFLRARMVFLVVSSAAVLWVYLLVLWWRRHAGEAFVAAALLGLSWEFAYHARWIAPDLVMTGFAALTMLLVMLASMRERPARALMGAAVAAGLATGSKYQCGLLLLPILIQVLRSRGHSGVGGFWRGTAKVLVVFGATFIVTTPAVLLDTGRVLRWIVYVANQYKSGDHGGYAVKAGLPHLGKMLVYLGADFFSAHLPIALAGSLFVFIGVWSLVRDSRWQALVFLSFPVVYLAYMSTQRVFIVRNIIVVTPFLAVLAARGVRFTVRLVPSRFNRQAAAVAVVLCALGLGANAVWLYRAALSIPRTNPAVAVFQVATYVRSRPPKTVFASNAVRAALQGQQVDLSLLASHPQQGREWLFYPYEWAGEHSSNVWRATMTWFGPYEINWNRYTDWAGFQRILRVTSAQARSAGIKLDPIPGLPPPPPEPVPAVAKPK